MERAHQAIWITGIVVGAVALTSGQAQQSTATDAAKPPAAAADVRLGEWPVYGHDAGGMRHSPLTQITPTNVARLQRVWTYETQRAAGASPAAATVAAPGGRPRTLTSQLTPLVIDGVMFVTTPFGRAVALDPETGKELWSRNLGDERPAQRGLAYWPGDAGAPPTLFFGTSGGFLLALNAKTGQPVKTFGTGGRLDLRTGMPKKFPNASYNLSSTPVIYRSLVITGSRVQETPSLGPPGDVRAWDARTGKLVWQFHTIPQPGEDGHDTWEGDSWKDRSGANVWGGMTVDVERGLLFLPLGCATYDYFGGDRKGANLFGSTLVALEAATGKRKWHFQTTHHDVWDYDLTAPPTLFNITRDGRTIPAVGQITKQGLLFIFDRVTGEPVFGVEERPVPQDGFFTGEHPWPTQPFPVKPPPLARNSFDPKEIATVTPEHRAYCEDLLKKDGGLRAGGPYLPFGLKPSLIFPGTLGGNNWHGSSFSPDLGYLFTNTMNLGEVYQIVPKPADETGRVPELAQRWKFWDGERYWPCHQPPWGELSAVNVNTGEIVWRVPLGGFPELEAKGLPKTGAPNIGGSISTAGGLLFIGATVDAKFRAFDAKTGQELWVTDIGGAAHSVPITYAGRDGKQYVAVMVGGGGFLRSPSIPATLMVYALP